MKSKQGKQGGNKKQEKNEKKVTKLKLQPEVEEDDSDIEDQDIQMNDDDNDDGSISADTDGDDDDSNASDSDEDDDEAVENEDEDDSAVEGNDGAEDSDDDEDDDDDDDDDDDVDDDEDDEDDDSDEASDDEDSEEDDDEVEEKVEDIKPNKKRKVVESPKQEEMKPSKKRKLVESVTEETKRAKLEPSKPKGIKTLFLRMPSRNFESSAIKKFFSGHQIEILEIRQPQGRNFGYADIQANKLESALKLSGSKVDGKQIQIEIAKEKPAEEKQKDKNLSKKAQAQNKSLFVKNLPYDVTDDDIKSHFPLALSVSTKRLPNGKLLGYAHLDFESEEVAEKVMSELQNSKIKGRPIALDYVGKKRINTKPLQVADESSKTLFVKQLAYDATKEEVKAKFKKSTDIRIATDPKSGKSKGFAFIVFDSHEDASKAMEKMQGTAIKGRNIAISFSSKPSESKGPASKTKDKTKNKKQNKKKPPKKPAKDSDSD